MSTTTRKPAEKEDGPIDQLRMPLIASLALGLAPFVPEPHLVGKIRWVAGGAVGMGAADWFDLVMHGAPWLWLAFTLVKVGMQQMNKGKSAPAS